MAPKKDDKPVDPRSNMTDRDKFIPRSFHAPSTLAAFATYIRKHEDLSPTEAVRKALRLCGKPDHYSADTDPTMEKAVELTQAASA
jgi:hypothetical protein